MAVYIEIVAPNGALVNHHTVQKIEMFGAFATILLTVHSYTEASVEAVGGMVQWCWSLSFAPDELKTMGRDGAETLLVNSVNSPFVGGAVIEGMSELESKVRVKQIQLRGARDAFEFGGFDWSGHRFDSDQISQQRIGNACLKALVAQGAGIPFSEDWTLADNSILSGITIEQMLSIGMAMGEHVGSAHKKSRLLRAQIDAAQTVEDILAISW